MPDIEGPYTVTAPLDRLWERYRSLGAAQPADFEAFLVAEVERLTKERDHYRLLYEGLTANL